MSHTSLPSSNSRLFPVSLSWSGQSIPVGALVDSGADECLMDHTFAIQNNIPLIPLEKPLTAQGIDGHNLSQIAHQTTPLTLTITLTM